jgi:hypothetical protein
LSKQITDLSTVGIIGRCIVTGDAETLEWGKISELIGILIINVHRLLTFLDIPKSSRTFANAMARLTLEWDSATSTRSNRMHIGHPSQNGQ